MFIDFHTHGKLAKKLPFSEEYTHWLFAEAKKAGLDALCLTEHFNTLGFEQLYRYLAEHAEQEGDSYVLDGLRIFPGMETDIAEGGHILSIGPMEAILELNQCLEPYKRKGSFLPFKKLMDLFDAYPVLVGGAHPFRAGGHIPDLPEEQLQRLDFLDLNGKDIAENRTYYEEKTMQLGHMLNRPVISGSDTHQAVQYGCIRTHFDRTYTELTDLYEAMRKGQYEICISEQASVQVKTAALLKRALKEIHALHGNYVAVLLGQEPAWAAVHQEEKGE